MRVGRYIIARRYTYVRLPADESLDRDQWLVVADRLEKKLGFEGQPRGVALHFLEDGTTHMHVGWSRIDTDEMKAIDPGLYIRKMKEVSRELEKEFGMRELSSHLPPDRLTAGVKRSEFEEARRLGVDLVPVRETIRDCYDRSDNGPSFAAALADNGLTIARGDQRDFVILDAEGGQHALGKRITGESAADIRARFGEEFKASLPSVEEAREQIEARRRTARGGQGDEAPAGISRDTMKAEVTGLWQAADTGRAFVASVEEAGYVLARGDRRDFVIVDQEGNPHNLARMIDGAKPADIRAVMVDVDRAALPTVAEAKAEIRSTASSRDIPQEAVGRAEAISAPIPTPEISPPTGPAVAKEEKPLSATAGEIRLAYALSDSGRSFAEGLEDRGISFAVVTPEEAAASQRLAAFARQVGNFAPSYAEGELVAVNSFGGVYRLDKRTTGDSKDEVSSYLATVDRDSLLGVTETRDVMREASRTSFIHEQALNRPLSSVESRIEEMRAEAQTPAQFVAAMQGRGLYLARADQSDVAAIRAEYPKSDNLTASALKIEEGELVAVNAFGGIHRLQSPKFDTSGLAGLWEQGSDPRFGSLESVASVRGDLLEARAESAAIWNSIREERDAGILDRSTVEHGDSAVPSVGVVVDDLADTAGSLAQGVAKGFEKALEAVAKPVEIFANIIADMFGASKTEMRPAPAEPPAMTFMEQRRAEHRALHALDRIAGGLRGENEPSAADVRSLTPAHLQAIKEGGVEELIRLAEWHESAKQRERDDDLGRERER